MDVAAELGRSLVSSTRFSLSMEMSRLTRDGTAEPVSRDQILRHARGQGNIHFPCSADHGQDWQPYPVDPYSAIYVSWYRPGSVRLDTRRLNKVNTCLLHSEKDRRRKRRRRTRKKKKKCRVRQHKRDSRSSNITEYFPNNHRFTVLDKPTVTK